MRPTSPPASTGAPVRHSAGVHASGDPTAEKNRHAAWNEICWAIRAPASIPTTERRPVAATIPVASTVNTTKVPDA